MPEIPDDPKERQAYKEGLIGQPAPPPGGPELLRPNTPGFGPGDGALPPAVPQPGLLEMLQMLLAQQYAGGQAPGLGGGMPAGGMPGFGGPPAGGMPPWLMMLMAPYLGGMAGQPWGMAPGAGMVPGGSPMTPLVPQVAAPAPPAGVPAAPPPLPTLTTPVPIGGTVRADSVNRTPGVPGLTSVGLPSAGLAR